MEDQRKYVIIYDIESYPDYFCIGTREYYRPNKDARYRKVKGGTFIWTLDDMSEFKQYLNDTKDCLWVGFNNAQYDDLMIIRAIQTNVLKKTTDQDMRKLNDYLIKGNVINPEQHIAPSDIYYVVGGKVRISNKNRRDLWQPKVADIMLLSGEGSLKMKAIILNSDSIMESPISFNEEVGNRRELIHQYLLTDLTQTFLIYEHLENEFKVRDTFFDELPDIAYGVNSPKLADEYFRHHTKSLESAKINYSGKNLKASSLLANDDISFKNKELREFFKMFNSGALMIPNEYTKANAKFDFSVKLIDPDTGIETDTSIIDLGIPQHQFQFGTGGLHSANKNGVWKCDYDEVIYNIDVKSYYPSMIESYSINPAHVPDYSRQMSTILSNRFKVQRKYKETGDKEFLVAEQALKLLMNSSFGKLKDKFSYLYDQKAMFTVTITGQILLLKVIDMLIDSKIAYEMVNANTDGIFIKTKRSNIEALDKLCREWEKLAKVKLDYELFTSWYQYTVNEYFAVSESGKVKSKGTRCLLQPDLSKKMPISRIVKRAVFEYVHNGKDPMETLRSCDKIEDFLMSANSTDFETCGNNVGYKAIRVVYSNSGTVFHALKNDNVNGGFKKSIVLDAEPLKFIKVLSDQSITEIDINYDRYCWDVWKNIYTLLKPRNDNNDVYFMPAKQPEYHWSHIKMAIDKLSNGLVAEWYDYLVSLGLSVIPKNICKVNYKGVRTLHKETWGSVDPRKCLGLGIVMDNHCSIDIDNPEMMPDELIELLERYDTMKVWHGKDRVLNGGKGAFIFKGSPALKSASLADKVGFEFFNDHGKMQMCVGVHPKGEFYKISGEPIEIPEELLTYLMNLKIDGKRAIPRRLGERKESTRKQKSPKLKIDTDFIQDKLRDSDIYLDRFVLSEDKTSMQCWDSNRHWFVVSIDNRGKYHVSSNHSSFLNEISSLFN